MTKKTPPRDKPKPTAPPVGTLQPVETNALAAMNAIESGNIGEAEKCIAAMAPAIWMERGWRRYLQGLVAIERVRLVEAQRRLHEAASLAHLLATKEEGSPEAGDALRLASTAWHHLGRVYRRQDRPEEALHVHESALKLRKQYGSAEEQWETTIELGLDADVARRFEDAAAWYQTAIAQACHLEDRQIERQARSGAHLSRSLAKAGQFEDALTAARQACALWRQHDAGCAETALADAGLGEVLLEYGASLHENNQPQAGEVLKEAVASVTQARQMLQAFGRDHASDVSRLSGQADLAQRLMASAIEG